MSCLCIWKLSAYWLHHLQIFSPQSVGCLLVFVYDFLWLGLVCLFLLIKACCLPKVKVNYLFWEWENEVTQSCPTFCNPMNCLPTPSSLPGSSLEPFPPEIPERAWENEILHPSLVKAICPLKCNLLLKRGKRLEGPPGWEGVCGNYKPTWRVSFHFGGEVPEGTGLGWTYSRCSPWPSTLLILNAVVPSRNHFYSLTCSTKIQ